MPLVTQSNEKKYNHAVFVGMIYSALLILSNLTAAKIIAVGGMNLTAALLFFPLTYIFDDVLTEVYGFKMSRRIIWLGLFANAIVTFGGMLAAALPPASFWPNQAAFETVFSLSLRIFIASSIGYLCGEFINSVLMAKIKVWTQGRHFWLRAILSSCCGVGLDTLLFCSIAFYGTMPFKELWHMMLLIYMIKICYEIIALPLSYKLANYLKRLDNVDYYDYTTRFNPFSLKL